MQRFILESPHLVEQCSRIQDWHTAGYLHRFGWGGKDNDHTGWAPVETQSIGHARQMGPWYVREQARLVRLVKFNPQKDGHRWEGVVCSILKLTRSQEPERCVWGYPL